MPEYCEYVLKRDDGRYLLATSNHGGYRTTNSLYNAYPFRFSPSLAESCRMSLKDSKRWSVVPVEVTKKEKRLKTGFFCGRLQHIHLGHQRIIDMGLKECDKLLIVVGSAQESGTVRNPFPADVRVRLIEKIYHEEVQSGKLIVRTLDDMTHENDICVEWGKYLLGHVTKWLGQKPDVMLYGDDESREGWFDPADIEGMEHIKADRNSFKISATEVREYMYHDDYEHWCGFVDHHIHHYYPILQKVLQKSPQL